MIQPEGQNRTGILRDILIGITVTLVGGFVLAYLIQDARFDPGRRDGVARESSKAPLQSTALEAGATQTRAKDGAVMVYVPAGEFSMGSAAFDFEAADDEKPRREVRLDAFWIDRTAVTNAQYQQCVEAGACSLPEQTSAAPRGLYYGNPDYDNYPVVQVTWYQARDYARWVGGRLPTEAEWEYACRGPEGFKYPWGERAPTEDLVNCCRHVDETTPVDAYPRGASWCDALDLSGNVWEWTSSLYKDYPYDATDGRERIGAAGYRVIRGGASGYGPDNVRCAYRGSANPDGGDWFLGFRVCFVA